MKFSSKQSTPSSNVSDSGNVLHPEGDTTPASAPGGRVGSIPQGGIPGVPIVPTGTPGYSNPYALPSYPQAPLVSRRRDDEAKGPNTGMIFLVMIIMYAAGIATDRAWQIFMSDKVEVALSGARTANYNAREASGSAATGEISEVACLEGRISSKHSQLRSWEASLDEYNKINLNTNELQQYQAIWDAERDGAGSYPELFACGSEAECEQSIDVDTAVGLSWMMLNSPETGTWQELPAVLLRESVGSVFGRQVSSLAPYEELVYDEQTDTILTLGPVTAASYRYGESWALESSDGRTRVWVRERLAAEDCETGDNGCSCPAWREYLELRSTSSGFWQPTILRLIVQE